MKSPESETEFKENTPETKEELPREHKHKQQRWLWLLLALPLLMGGGFLAWRVLTPQNPASAPPVGGQPPPPQVKISEVETGIIESSSKYIANLESRRSVTLQPRIQGQVSQIFVRSGAEVVEGAPIIQVDAREQQASVSSVKAAAAAASSELENARATLKSLEAERLSNLADLRFNEQEYERYSMLAAQGAVSRQTRDTYVNRLATTQAELVATEARIRAQQAVIAQAEKAVQQAQANIEQQQVQLQYYTITAPFTGTVDDIPVKEGDFVNTNTQLTTITQNKPLEVEIRVPIERSSQLRRGMTVELMDGQDRVIGMSRVFFIAPNSNDNNPQSILIKSLFDNSKGELLAGQQVQARVIWNQRPGVLVPVTAVTQIAGKPFVFVPETQSQSGKSQLIARQKRVKLGEISGNNYQIIEGLKPGEEIITSGLLNLRDGIPIVPVAPES
jgi:RND family efflux transporter MFP subunit